jgi:hypothetical protein
MKEQDTTTIKEESITRLDIRAENNIPVTDLAEFIKSNTKNAKSTITDQKR